MTTGWRIRNVTVIACDGSAPNAAMTVTGSGTEILAVTAADQNAPHDTDLSFDIDGSGKYLIPGLVNAHEHLDMHRTPGTMHERMQAPAEQLVLRAARNAAWDLANGVTAIRDLGSMNASNIQIRDAIDQGRMVGPTVVACGQMIAMTGGHGQPLCVEVDGPVEALRETRRQLKLGADVIKVCASGGVVARERENPWLAELSLEEIRAIVAEAHMRDTKVAAHAQPPAAIEMSVKAGVDSIEHGAFMDKKCAEMIAEAEVFYVPTIGDTVNVIAHGHELGRPAWMIEAAAASLDRRRNAVSLALDAGVRFATGTDVAGELGGEMAELVRCGMDPMDALMAATSGGAALLGLERTGTVEPGMTADLVLLDSDPLTDLASLESTIHSVIKGGVMYDPTGLKSAWSITS